MNPAVALVAELTGRGIELRAEGGRLLFKPVSAVSPELAARLKRHKGGLLAILGGKGEPESLAPVVAPVVAPVADLPPRPADRPGMVTELVIRGGEWVWRHRREDEADRAWRHWESNGRIALPAGS